MIIKGFHIVHEFFSYFHIKYGLKQAKIESKWAISIYLLKIVKFSFGWLVGRWVQGFQFLPTAHQLVVNKVVLIFCYSPHSTRCTENLLKKSPPPALSDLKSALSGLKSALSGLESALSSLKSANRPAICHLRP